MPEWHYFQPLSQAEVSFYCELTDLTYMLSKMIMMEKQTVITLISKNCSC